jgi:endonuclease/exonuclease/phosphatase family metal-dependent hydrolase
MPGRRRFSSLIPLLALAGCGTLPPLRHMTCDAAPSPVITRSADGREASTTFSVLTYNIEGLGWPARGNRAPQLAQIGQRLAAMRRAGSAPDIVLFQEMFSGPAKNAVLASGYPAIVTGPRRTTRPDGSTRDPLPGKAKVKRGEIGLHMTGGGLAIGSDYPIVDVDRRAYGRRSCAGLDCLANKGIMLARIAIPGVPTPIDIYNTHMNSRGASRAPARRNLAAHDRQALEASEFIDATHDDAFPVVFGGDFNMRRSQERWDNFSRYQSLALVHHVCADPDSRCALDEYAGPPVLLVGRSGFDPPGSRRGDVRRRPERPQAIGP